MDEVILRIEDSSTFFERVQRDAHRIDEGDYTPLPASISFESMARLLDVLTPGRWSILEMLRATGPSSIRGLSKVLGRDYRGVHADVQKLLHVGLMEKDEGGKISVPWSKIVAEVSLDRAA